MSAPATPNRARLAAVIPHRPKVSWPLAIALGAAFTLLITPILVAESWLGIEIRAGEPAGATVRIPEFAGLATPDAVVGGGSIVVARGEVPDEERAALANAALGALPRGTTGVLAHIAIVLMLSGLYTHHLRRSHRGRLLRVQLVNLGVLATVALVVKLFLLLTPISVLLVPVALAAVVPTIVFDRTVGLATGVLSAIIISMLVPFDMGVATVLTVQASVAGVLIPERTRSRWRVTAAGAVVGAVSGALVYGVVHYLATGDLPVHQLAHPAASSWVAATVGGLLAGVLAAPLTPAYEVLVGEITQASLVRLEDLSHPMLKQIAEKSPGTWQHSLAMANLAEIAANAIGASGRLVRVGAYFHDLGKSLQPKYFIENLEAGESSPHDRLPPEVSCDAIFAHVTEGIAVARKAGLPERIIDFMHMHHGDGVLEYFWAKCKDLGNPKSLTMEDFRYPGVPPQSRETAILAICDAVEAASRTLKRPDDHAVAGLVQRIVYGKLHLGQLDESGLSMADLRKISDSLRETIKHAHHGRIEYPWQRAEREALVVENATPATAAAIGIARTQETAALGGDDGVVRMTPPRSTTTTQRIMEEPRLDSLDVPRPLWRDPGFAKSGADQPTRSLVREGAAVATTDVMPRPVTPVASEGSGGTSVAAAAQAAQAAVGEAIVDEQSSVHRAPTRLVPEEEAGEARYRAETRQQTDEDHAAALLAASGRVATEDILSVVPPERARADGDGAKRRTQPPPPPPGHNHHAEAPPSGPPAPAPAQPARPATPTTPASPAPMPRPPSAVEIQADDVEGVMDISPAAPAVTGGLIVGPPPATRKVATGNTQRMATVPPPPDDEAPETPAEAPPGALPPRSGVTKPPPRG
jgi:putative nucleotidyltransferase with HDIG domain